jgi:uncharacterized membrane protein
VPVGELPAGEVVSGREVVFFGLRYVVPVVEQWPRTIVAVNVGGAVIPTLVSAYLLRRAELWLPAAVGVSVVTVVVHALARPIPGVGIGAGRFDGLFMTGVLAVLLA